MKSPRPSTLAKFLLAAYAIALVSLALLNGEQAWLMVPQVLAAAWMASPAALAALLVSQAPNDLVRSWGGLALEAMVVASTAWVIYGLVQHRDPQNGLAFIWLPLVQFACVGVGSLGLYYVSRMGRAVGLGR